MNIIELKDLIQPKVEEPKKTKLVFTKVFSSTGAEFAATARAEDWKNIVHVGGNWYWAYNDTIDSGRMYIGEYQ